MSEEMIHGFTHDDPRRHRIIRAGGGRAISADPLAFVLAASGRSEPGSLGLDETVNIYR